MDYAYRQQPQTGDRVWQTVDSYQQGYWNALDARFYAGDILLDELIGLQYEIQEAKAPLFGYWSYTYESVLRGARRVQGALVINYKRETYLFEILDQLARQQQSGGSSGADARSPEAARLARTGVATIEDFLQIAQGGAADNGGLAPAPGDKQGRLRFDPELFRAAAAEFRRELWGTNPGPVASPRERFSTQPRWGQGFDLTIKFGGGRERADERDAVGALVAPSQLAAGVSEIKVITGLEFTGTSVVIEDSGRAIAEQYPFIAKDVL